MYRTYTGRKLDHVAFPMGGIGAGMLCIEGTGSFGSVSVRHAPNIFCEPNMFAAVSVKSPHKSARVLEGQVPKAKYYGFKVHGFSGAGNGMPGKNYGLPRFRNCSFISRFPFAEITLSDENEPYDVEIVGYSPFVPGDADASSLPAASVRYTLKNKTDSKLDAVFYFSAFQFMGLHGGEKCQLVRPIDGGFVLEQLMFDDKPHTYGAFAITTDTPANVNTDFYRGGWWDSFTMRWNTIEAGIVTSGAASDNRSPGGALEIPFSIEPHSSWSVTVHMNWYVPDSNLRAGADLPDDPDRSTYKPWYAGKYGTIEEVVRDYRMRHAELLAETEKFTSAFYDTDLPPVIVEAVAANLSILKSPTLLRQIDGRLWGWEGCADTFGSCHGSCQHVYNYAQALCHLFPSLERTLRETEFNEDMDEHGHQQFRTSLPIRKNSHDFYAASDGQPGGIMKMYREWRISGDTEWIASYWDKLVLAMEYCIRTWDPDELGVFREPHHNTYDIEFWGADGMCSSFYLGALRAMVEIGRALNRDVSRYDELYSRGREYLESKLFNGEYFFQVTEWKTLRAKFDDHGDPVISAEGPKYQYGNGCISDGVLGAWIALVCGLGEILDPEKVKSHLLSVYKYNFREHLYDHANPQRPGYALGDEGGLLLCTWPHGGKPSLPFVYSDEVWTGIEYQVAAHLAWYGYKKEAEHIVRTLRERYDGERRNPYDEYECGHWYIRALASYALIEAYTGVRYDAVTKTLYAKAGKSRSFLATETGYGTVTVDGTEVKVEVVRGKIEVEKVEIIE
ncbi:MAG TPA: GH116 family glycosyl hydrolase [Bacillota bacterium]|nr:GH116 family glycosyl hydrolase [Bacillota bacterium]